MYESVAISDQNKDRYKQYQKEAQIIQITGTDPTVTISASSLIPNFQNISMNEKQAMSYQLRSARFQNTFDNIVVGDAIQLKVSLLWNLYDNTNNADFIPIQQSTLIATDPEYIRIDLSQSPSVLGYGPPLNINDYGQSSQICSAEELVSKINDNLRNQGERTYRNYLIGAVPAPTVNLMNMMYLAALGQFVFSNSTGKIGFQYNSTAPVTPIGLYPGLVGGPTITVPANGVASVQVWLIQGVSIEIITNEADTLINQERIANYFSMIEYASTGLGWAGIGPAPVVPYGYLELAIVDLQGVAFTFEQLSVIINTQAAGPYQWWFNNWNQIGNGGPAVDNLNTAGLKLKPLVQQNSLFAQVAQNSAGCLFQVQQAKVIWWIRAMNVNPYTDIYIRTTLNTNYWNSDGRKQDVMEVIPIQSSQINTAQQLSNITRIYQAKDSSIHTFEIRFTDAAGNLLAFNDPYSIQIAIFFQLG